MGHANKLKLSSMQFYRSFFSAERSGDSEVTEGSFQPKW